MEIINIILMITGIISIFIFFVKFLFKNNRWIDNIKIRRTIYSEELENEYSSIYFFGDEKLQTVTIIEGDTFPIRKINIYNYEFNGKKIKKGKLVYSIKDLLPKQSLFLKLEYGCAVAQYIIEITNYQFEKATIPLQENGFNGNVNIDNGIKFKITLFSKIYNLFFS